MTIEEVIYALDMVEHIESISTFYDPGEPMNHTTVRELKEACRMAIAALRAQQAPAKLDRSRWEGCRFCKDDIFVKRRQYMRPIIEPLTPEQALMDKLTDITGIVYVKVKNKFCPMCGRPLTEEARAELQEKIGGTTL